MPRPLHSGCRESRQQLPGSNQQVEEAQGVIYDVKTEARPTSASEPELDGDNTLSDTTMLPEAPGQHTVGA